MEKIILGVDNGTNSIGWSIVKYDDEAPENKYTLIDKGVNIFQEGVKIEKGIESSRAAERTNHKHQRIGYWRRKTRKIKLLQILNKYHLCPPLSKEELKKWRSQKIYPMNEAFMAWQRTDDNVGDNPYYFRHLCLTEKLDLSDLRNRYIVGRALYHLNQRRGFLSNRKENTKESDGKVKQEIEALAQSMKDCETEYLGEYFNGVYQKKGKIRTHYTSRFDCEKEVLAICRKQGLPEELTQELCQTIIMQRPLKSQKHTVGKCVFEPSKSRCPMSHPLYEQYRMYAFINNIKIQSPNDHGLRPLSEKEKQDIVPLFLRKSKKEFKFEEIAKKLSGGKKNFCYYKDKAECAFRFNYYMDTLVSGCPVIAQLSEAFDVKNKIDEWLERACEVYTHGDGKNRYEIMNDIWHVLFFFDNEDKLKEFALEKLQMDEAHAILFSKIHLPSDYASLSLKAIRKILPYMKEYGMIYSHAVFLANLLSVIHCKVDKEALLPMLSREETDDIVKAFYEYDPSMSAIRTQEEYVKRYIAYKYNLDEEGERKLKSLYHPSMIETFPKVRQRTAEGYYQLGSPRTNSLRNPMAMRSLFRLRHVINALLKEGKIDEDTTIHIEFARELNDANKRAAIRQWQGQRNKRHQEIAEKIKEHFGNDYVPSSTEILKYELWEEQNHLCLYTGETISLADLFDSNKYDIEHTIPRSVGGDSTAMNLTICNSRYNRETKQAQIPSQMSGHEQIMERIDGWKETIEKLGKEIRKINTRGISDKEAKDRMIQKRHRLMLERDYWKGKYDRFTMTAVPEGFSRRQGVDISIISKYARSYLKSIFKNVYIVKGIATSDFRKIWGIQEGYEKKQRVNHCHHAIDAVTIACIGKAEYDKLAQYYHDEERWEWGLESRRAKFPKPWNTFTEDMQHLDETLLVSHYTADNLSKQTRKKIRKNGRITGQYMQGDTARGSLHQDTYYGAIEHEGEIKYVVRKSLDQLDEKNVKNIVDNVVREKVEEAIEQYGNLKKAVEVGIWMNREKGIAIHKVRIYTPQVKRPLDIRQQRDLSPKEYKRNFHVVNDSNYMMGIYAGKSKKGKEKREFELINNMNAVEYYNSGVSEQNIDILPSESKNGYPLKWKLRVGTMVLLYDETPEEIYELDEIQLCKRLYKITGMSSMIVTGCNYGVLSLLFHQEARPSKDVTLKNGIYKHGEATRAGITLLHTQFKALVQGYDFEMDDLGKIKFKNR